MQRHFFAIAGASILTSLAFVASAKLVGIGDSSSRFEARGPAGMKIDGSASNVSAVEDASKLKLSVSLADLKTGMDLRDKHAKKYLKAERFPTATLLIERGKLSVPQDNKAAVGDASGDFTLAGVTKPLSFHYEVTRTGSDLHVSGSAVVDMRTHGIETPCYLGVCVDPHVKIAVKFKLREQS